ncbi:MAG: hypothetical protein JWP57_4031, partial [Spirosoma sp.]|nr:hypothetical protein [Spirosoma sp.]
RNLFPESGILRIMAAELASLAEDWGNAVAAWKTIMASRPHKIWKKFQFIKTSNPAAPWMYLAEAYARTEDFRNAVNTLRHGEARYPDNQEFLIFQAKLSEKWHDWWTTGAYWDKAVLANNKNLYAVEMALSTACRLPAPDSDSSAPDFKRPAGGFFFSDRAARDWNTQIRGSIPLLKMQIKETMPSLQVIDNAIIMPNLYDTSMNVELSQQQIHAGGVYDSYGRLVSNSIQIGFPMNNIPMDIRAPYSCFEEIPGVWLYGGGQIHRHVGHFILDCIGRLWGAGEVGYKIAGIMYNTNKIPALLNDGRFDLNSIRRSNRFMSDKSNDYATAFSKIFAGTANTHVISSPVQIEKLVVPSQLFGTYNHLGSQYFRDFIRRAVGRLDAQSSAEFPKKIYVSRSRLPTKKSKFFLEDMISEVLRENDYHVIYPEELSIVDQLLYYWNAEHIVMASGSAAHVAALAMNGKQKVCLIDRIPNQEAMYEGQLKIFGAKELVRISCVNGKFFDGSLDAPRQKANAGLHTVDIAQVFDQLISHKFIGSSSVSGLDFGAIVEQEKQSCVDFLNSTRKGSHHAFLDF